jgi:hypothetical protein
LVWSELPSAVSPVAHSMNKNGSSGPRAGLIGAGGDLERLGTLAHQIDCVAGIRSLPDESKE